MTVEEVFSARQAADRLGLSPAMTRRYGAALEELTKEPIRQHPRDGRQYRREQLETMQRAKSFVEANPRLSVAQALQLALGEAPAVATPAVPDATPAVPEGSETPSEALSEALVQALERTLLPELRALREEVAGLRAEQREGEVQGTFQSHTALESAEGAASAVNVAVLPPDRDDEPSKTPEAADGPSAADGVLVRTARWLERLLRRSR